NRDLGFGLYDHSRRSDLVRCRLGQRPFGSFQLVASAATATAARGTANRRRKIRTDVDHLAELLLDLFGMLRNISGDHHKQNYSQHVQNEREDKILGLGLIGRVLQAVEARQHFGWTRSSCWRSRGQRDIILDRGTRHEFLEFSPTIDSSIDAI